MQRFSPDARLDGLTKIGIAVVVLITIALISWLAGWKFLTVLVIVLVPVAYLAFEFFMYRYAAKIWSRRE
jgi:hypothetical protein